jgi:gas vesicle protein
MSGSRKNTTRRFIVVLGVGALIGILLAPKSGRETQAAITTEVNDGRKYVAALGHDARKHLNEMGQSGRKMLAPKK